MTARSFVLTWPALERAEISLRIEDHGRLTFEAVANVLHIADKQYKLRMCYNSCLLPDELLALRELLQQHFPHALWRDY